MQTIAPSLPIVAVGDPEVAAIARNRREGSDPAPGTGPSWRTPFNLARPWSFPGGHADSVLCRRHPRTLVQIPVEISLHRPDGSCSDKGTGIIGDLSYSGLRLDDVFLVRGRLLAIHFGVELRPAFESREGPPVAGRILRTFSSGVPGFGIEFRAPGSGAAERLRQGT